MSPPFSRPELDRRIRQDKRNWDYPIRPYVTGIPRRTTLWKTGPRLPLNQRTEGGSVAFAWTAMLEQVDSVRFPGTEHNALELVEHFREVEQADARKAIGEPARMIPMAVGSSILAGARYVKYKGWIPEYRWCFSPNDVVDSLCAYGPVLLGFQWFESMYETDSRGIVQSVSGPGVGGHAVLATGYISADDALRRGMGHTELIRFANSFGPGYGSNGTGYLRLLDLAFLMKQNGEGLVPSNMSPVEELSGVRAFLNKPWTKRLTSAFRRD